jgi:hypothetical protein
MARRRRFADAPLHSNRKAESMQDDPSHPLGRRSRGSSVSAWRSLRVIVPGVVLGAGLWLMPGESVAAPRCTSKPAVCSRLEAEQRQRARMRAAEVARSLAPTPDRLAVAAQDTRPRCITKPVVCARFASRGAAPAQPPVTIAQSSVDGPRCSSKPAVCARLRVRPNAPPTTIARDEGPVTSD